MKLKTGSQWKKKKSTKPKSVLWKDQVSIQAKKKRREKISTSETKETSIQIPKIFKE